MRPGRQTRSPLPRSHQRGFTLIELVLVIVIIGIMCAVAITRMLSTSSFDGKAYADQVSAMLRFGQKVAIAQNRNVFVRVGAAGVALCYQGGCGAGARVLAPAGANSGSTSTRAVCADDSWACEAPPSGVTVGVEASFYFDPVGKPFAPADVPPTPTSSFSGLTVPIAGGGAARSITVERETGYVH